jgi:hypothetical protein
MPARPVPDPVDGLPLDPSAVRPVVEPAQPGSWVLKMRSIQATVSGSVRQWTFYTAASGGAHLAIHAASVKDCERSLEQDAARLRRDARMFDVQASLGMGLAHRLQHERRSRPEPEVGSWSDETINVDGAPVLIRYAPVGDRGWAGYFARGDQVIEIHSDALSANQIALVQASPGDAAAG